MKLTTAELWGGMSGGPTLENGGQTVVGINHAYQPHSKPPESLYVPVDQLKPLLPTR
jgi:hypothetical protein